MNTAEWEKRCSVDFPTKICAIFTRSSGTTTTILEE